VAQTCVSRSAAFLADRVQGPLTYKAGPRYACFATGAIVSSRSHRAPPVRSGFACAFPRPAEDFAPRRRQREGVESGAWWHEGRRYEATYLAYHQAGEPPSVPKCHIYTLAGIRPASF
jgi:hypothetical protein